MARLAVSFDRELARAVKRSAGQEPTSSWLADAARRKLRSEGLARVVREWEEQHGEITDQEIGTVARRQRARKRR